MNTFHSSAQTAQIVCTIRSLVTELHSRGLDYSAIENGIHAFPKSSRLVIEGNGRISFPDYKAKVYLNWSSASWFDPENPFEDPEIRVICNRDITAPIHTARDYGLYVRDGKDIINMATLVPRWGVLYRTMIEMMLDGTFDAAGDRQSVTNYWWGLGSRIIDVAFSSRPSLPR